uniref:Tetraspanin-15 n=1 Tax=Eptatretus burgeri TaxID=7764 RepID=A0A8C4QLL3_EPTBU
MACGIGANTCAALTYRCLKYSLFVYCFLFWVLGLVLLLLGIYAETERPETRELQQVFLAPAIILILCGLTLFSISLIGAVGALRDNTTFLHTFFGFLVVGLLLQLFGGVLALIFRHQAYNFFNNRLRNGIRHYYDDLDFKNIMDFTQMKLSCCGADSYMDWKVNEYHSCEAPGPAACGVPYSCCVQPKGVKPVINSQCGFGALLEEFLGLLLCCLYIQRLQDLINDLENEEKDQRVTLVETNC